MQSWQNQEPALRNLRLILKQKLFRMCQATRVALVRGSTGCAPCTYQPVTAETGALATAVRIAFQKIDMLSNGG